MGTCVFLDHSEIESGMRSKGFDATFSRAREFQSRRIPHIFSDLHNDMDWSHDRAAVCELPYLYPFQFSAELYKPLPRYQPLALLLQVMSRPAALVISLHVPSCRLIDELR